MARRLPGLCIGQLIGRVVQIHAALGQTHAVVKGASSKIVVQGVATQDHTARLYLVLGGDTLVGLVLVPLVIKVAIEVHVVAL